MFAELFYDFKNTIINPHFLYPITTVFDANLRLQKMRLTNRFPQILGSKRSTCKRTSHILERNVDVHFRGVRSNPNIYHPYTRYKQLDR